MKKIGIEKKKKKKKEMREASVFILRFASSICSRLDGSSMVISDIFAIEIREFESLKRRDFTTSFYSY